MRHWYLTVLAGSIILGASHKLYASTIDPYINTNDFVFLLSFKRGKFRPRLIEFIKSNTSEDVIENTTQGFKYLPEVEKAVKKLSELKGVGPATASGMGTMMSIL